ncbi:MAG: cytochrome c oxidase subunit II [Anaerolineae bacterium]|nr:cytochrome c oxidase subunit II [Anaerolineae bacterium]
MHVDEYEQYWIAAAVTVLGVFFAALLAGAVIFGVRLPDSGARINPLLIDQSEFANPGLRDMGDNQYEAVMVAQMWAFIPNEIRVPVGAEITFTVTSRDVTHGFYVEYHNVNLELVPGIIAQGRAVFNQPGEYHILCHEYCGRGHQGMHAVIIVGDENSTASASTVSTVSTVSTANTPDEG